MNELYSQMLQWHKVHVISVKHKLDTCENCGEEYPDDELHPRGKGRWQYYLCTYCHENNPSDGYCGDLNDFVYAKYDRDN